MAPSMLYNYLLRGCILFAIVLAWRRWKKMKATAENDANGTDGYCDSGRSRNGATREGPLGSHNFEKWPRGDADVLSRINGHGSPPISSLVVFGGGRRIATLRRGENKLQVWRIENDRLVEETDSSSIEHSNGAIINAMAASKDGTYIVSGDDLGNVMIWNTTTHPSRKVCEFVAAQGKITALDVSPDSLRVASGSEDGAVVVWSIKNGERLVRPLKDQDSPVSSVKFSPAGGRIASTYYVVGRDNCSVRIWHSRTGAQLESIPIDQSTYSLAWSADNRRLFIGGSRGSIKCFDIVTRSLLPGFRVPSGDLITTLCLTQNGQHLVSVSSGRVGSIDVWDIWDILPSEPFRSCREVYIAGFSADDVYLVSVGKEDGITIRSLPIIISKAHLLYRVYPVTRHLEPLTYISNVTYEGWKNGRLMEAEEALSKEIEDPRCRDFIRYERANRALVRARRKNWTGALEDIDAIVSSDGQIPLIASIANGLALHGQGGVDEAARSFKSTLRGCDSEAQHFVECVKRIAFFERPDATDIPTDSSKVNLHRLVTAYELFGLAKGHIVRGNYEAVLSSLEIVPDLRPLLYVPEATTISLIFGWNVPKLIFDIHELRCRALFESHHTPEVIGYFSEKGDSLNEELGIITGELSSVSEAFGDETRFYQRYDEAIAWYTEALALSGCPPDIVNRDVVIPQAGGGVVLNPGNDDSIAQCWAKLSRCSQCVAHLLAKRSEVEASRGSCMSALADANQAIEMDPSYSLGYHGKYAALLEMKHYKEAFGPLNEMFSKGPSDPEIDNLRSNYLETRTEIDRIIEGIFDASPFVLIHVGDGRLCNQEERRRRFKDDESFYKLVTSVSTKPNAGDIGAVVKRYFLYVMFSHTWEANEPSFDDVSGKIIYDLPNEKLRKFCETVRDDPKRYRWSWSDTCCINKKDSGVYEKSIRFMYKWYNNSALTLVLLADPSKSNPPNSPNLEHNRWMFRAWTLQELLAPEVIRFYDYTWKLYRNDKSDNHKTSPQIKRELARAIGLKEDALIHFDPEALPVRQKLRLASTRKATVEVDIAYSLIGIFNSDIRVEYTCEAYVALGRLLQECVNRQGEMTVFDWVGKSSKFNSSIPADISVYSQAQAPYTLPTITDIELDKRTEVLLHALPEQELSDFYLKLAAQDPPRFFDRRLRLPCITFSITSINPDISDGSSVQGAPAYIASTTALGEFQFQTKEAFAELGQGRLVLAYLWIPDLLTKVRPREGKEVAINATRSIVYLERGFKALLFTEQSHRQYRRVAADREITVPARQLTSLEGIEVETLEVWERL